MKNRYTRLIPAPRFFEAGAAQLFSFRPWFLATTVGGAAVLLMAPFVLASAHVVFLAFRVLLPLIMRSWGLLLVASRFHPQRGSLHEGRSWSAGLVRTYAVVFLTVWFLGPLLVLVLFP